MEKVYNVTYTWRDDTRQVTTEREHLIVGDYNTKQALEAAEAELEELGCWPNYEITGVQYSRTIGDRPKVNEAIQALADENDALREVISLFDGINAAAEEGNEKDNDDIGMIYEEVACALFGDNYFTWYDNQFK